MTVRILTGDCRELLRTLPDASIDACVTDPPYELGFMGKAWDRSGIANDPAVWAEVLRVLKPGAHLLAFGGTRTYHRMVCAIEDAGFEIRDQIGWVFGCLSDDTEILIDGQWEHYSKATKGRRALSYDVTHDTFSWQPIEQQVVYDYDEPAYRIRSERTDQIVSRNHRCIIDRGNGWEFVFAEEAARQQEVRVPVVENVPGLLAAVSGEESGSGGAQQDVFAAVQGGGSLTGQSGQDQALGAAQGAHDSMRGVRRVGVEAGCLAAQGQVADVFVQVQRQTAGDHAVAALAQGPGVLDAGVDAVLPRQDDRAEQPGLEGRRHVLPQARQLQADQVRAVPAGVLGDGAQGRLCDGAPADGGAGDRSLPAADGSGASRQPRPAGQRAGEPGTVRVQPGSQAARGQGLAVADVARIEPVAYCGIVWCVKVPTGAFVARRNGKVFVTGNSGFPKSLDVSKAIDKTDAAEVRRARQLRFTAWVRSTGMTAARIDAITGTNMGGHYTTAASQPAVATRELFEMLRPYFDCDVPAWIEQMINERTVESENLRRREIMQARTMTQGGGNALQIRVGERREVEANITAAHTEAARQWQGWGTALKPAWEPIVVARKPLIGTVAANVLAHGTGALNIEACRVGDEVRRAAFNSLAPCRGNALGAAGTAEARRGTQVEAREYVGRWPANLIHDGSDEVLAVFPDAPGQQGDLTGDEPSRPAKNVYGEFANRRIAQARIDTETSAARFFYCAKADSEDRNIGCKDLMTWESVDLNPVTDSLHALQRVTSDVMTLMQDDSVWSTSSYGSGTTARCRGVIKSITAMVSRTTTESRISNCSRPLNTSGSIRAATEIAQASGSSLAELAEFISQSAPATTDARMASALDAVRAALLTLFDASKSARRGNVHSTVKPTALMQYLVRLVTPPGGTVLDPFAGSGSTGVAADREGFDAVLIERDPEYAALARARIHGDAPLFAQVVAA